VLVRFLWISRPRDSATPTRTVSSGGAHHRRSWVTSAYQMVVVSCQDDRRERQHETKTQTIARHHFHSSAMLH
jgi:hypothetical protein